MKGSQFSFELGAAKRYGVEKENNNYKKVSQSSDF